MRLRGLLGCVRRAWSIGLTALPLLAATTPAAGAPLLDEAFLLGDQYQPGTRAFDVTTAGNYTLRLSDLQFPQPLGTAAAMLTRGTAPAGQLATFGTTSVALQGGRHKVLVAATPQSAGAFGAYGISLQPAGGGANVLDYSDQARSIQPASASLQSTLQASFDVTVAGTYRLTVADVAFPAPLQRLDVLVTTAGGAVVATLNLTAPSVDATLPVGRYNLLGFAEATAVATAGAYSVKVAGSGTQPYAQVVGVGSLGPGRAATLGAGTTRTLQVVDLEVPAPLSGVSVLVTRGDAVLARRDGAGSTSFDAAAGDVSLLVLQSPGAGTNRGASSIVLATGSSRDHEQLEVTSPVQGSGAAVLVAVPVDLPAAGTYRALLDDFTFPAAAATAALYVVQGGAKLAQIPAPGGVDATAAAGRLFLLVDATPNALSRSSLLGARVTQASATINETTLALGIQLQTRIVDVPAGGAWDLTVSDLAFPAALADLSLAVTRGGERVASIYGGGRVRFNATAGRYALNLLARATDPRGFGAYGLLLDAAPPAPVVTFTASSTRVRQGETTTLTWSTTGATACVASDGWSGSRGTSGTFTTAALNAGTRFTLTCSGPGGSSASSLDIEVRPVSTSGGGGAGGPGLGLLLATLALLGRRRRAA
jgi:hypothetical protein